MYDRKNPLKLHNFVHKSLMKLGEYCKCMVVDAALFARGGVSLYKVQPINHASVTEFMAECDYLMNEHVMVSTFLSESISGSTEVLEHIGAQNLSAMGQATIVCLKATSNL